MLAAMTHRSRVLNLDVKQSFVTPKSYIYIYIFIIKFQYNARSHWVKQRALSEYKARNKRKLTPSSAEMADKFPNFSLGITQFRGLFFL